MRQLLSTANLLWFGLVIVLTSAWHADHRELAEQIDNDQRQLISCQQEIDRLEKQLAQRPPQPEI